MANFTAIWQSENPHRDWVEEIFGRYIGAHVMDGKRELVLDDSILVDDFVYARDIGYYEKFRGKNAYLIHFMDEFYEVGSKVYENFRGVFRAFWSGAFQSKYLMILPVGYNRGMRRSGEPKPALERKYLWSFVGGVNKGSRPAMAKALARVEPHFLFATDDNPGVVMLNSLGSKRRLFSPKDCEGFLQESTFAPSPMGNANLECYRVYEALEAGSIPIVERRLTLDYYRKLLGDHPMPTVSNWREARSFIEKTIKQPEQLNAMQKECMQWWAGYKADYILKAGEFLAARGQSAEQASGPFLSAWGRSPFWQTTELARHHNFGALMKRIHTQLHRLVVERKFRMAFRGDRPFR
jgi:hypothetical protein